MDHLLLRSEIEAGPGSIPIYENQGYEQQVRLLSCEENYVLFVLK